MENSQTEPVSEDSDKKVKIPWDTNLALVIGTIYTVFLFLSNILHVNQTIPLSIVMFSQILLVMAGYIHRKNLKDPSINNQTIALFKQKYYLMVFSLIVYVIGSLLYILLFNSDSSIRLTYLSIIPILLATANNFNLLFESQTTTTEIDENLSKESNSERIKQQINEYKKVFKFPVVLGALGSIVIVFLPWFATTFSTFDPAYYSCNNCTESDLSKYTRLYTQFYGILNIGISRFWVYLVILLILSSGILIYYSFQYTQSRQSKNLALISMIVSMTGAFIIVAGINTLIYFLIERTQFGSPIILDYSLESGFIIGFIILLFSTAISMNIYKKLSEIFNQFSEQNENS